MPAEASSAHTMPPTQVDAWADVDGMVDFLNEDHTDGFLPDEGDLAPYALEPVNPIPFPHDAKRSRAADDGASVSKLPRTATATAQQRTVTAIAQPLPAAAVDMEEQALMGELSSFLGTGDSKQSLRMALELLRQDGESPIPRNATPPGSTPPSSPDESRPIGLAQQAGAAMGALGHSSAAVAQQRNNIDYTRFMDSHGFGVMMMDMNGNFLQWNQTLQNLLGYSREQMERLSMMHLTPAEDLAAMMDMMPRLHDAAMQPTLAAPLVSSAFVKHRPRVLRSQEHLPCV